MAEHRYLLDGEKLSRKREELGNGRGFLEFEEPSVSEDTIKKIDQKNTSEKRQQFNIETADGDMLSRVAETNQDFRATTFPISTAIAGALGLSLETLATHRVDILPDKLRRFTPYRCTPLGIPGNEDEPADLLAQISRHISSGAGFHRSGYERSWLIEKFYLL